MTDDLISGSILRKLGSDVFSNVLVVGAESLNCSFITLFKNQITYRKQELNDTFLSIPLYFPIID